MFRNKATDAMDDIVECLKEEQEWQTFPGRTRLAPKAQQNQLADILQGFIKQQQKYHEFLREQE